jgi:hypothetical protein
VYKEVDFITSEQEPRTLNAIVEAEAEMFDRVGYVRFVVRADKECAEYPEEIREEKFRELLEPPRLRHGGRAAASTS